MEQAKQGSVVKVHYTGKLKDGTVFDTSQEGTPLSFRLGEGQIIPGFEKAVEGMQPGQTKTTTIPVDEAYGPYREDLRLRVKRDQFPPNLQPEVGQHLQVSLDNGETLDVTVSEVGGETVTLDANHPLAGKDLVFDIQLLEVA
ncbi:MAG: peptidylprolyl isomerase [Actinobacteria bacterium]|nr:MAG: peptidylprolyl isomerase [Actinomycetota bacterium]